MEKFSPEALEKLARCFRLLMQLPDKEEKSAILTEDPALRSQAVNSDEEEASVSPKGANLTNEAA